MVSPKIKVTTPNAKTHAIRYQLEFVITRTVYDRPHLQQTLTLEGILFRLRTGIPWRDLPQEFGHWATTCFVGLIFGQRRALWA